MGASVPLPFTVAYEGQSKGLGWFILQKSWNFLAPEAFSGSIIHMDSENAQKVAKS